MTDSSSRGREWRSRLHWFAAEFLVVVTGVFVAIVLNGFYQRRNDAASESTYLTLLVRDVQATITTLEEEVAFQSDKQRAGLYAYRALSRPRQLNRDSVSAALGQLTVRRTLILQKPTYQDLINTGNLRLIGDRALRDRIVDYYESIGVQFEIINKNNGIFVDDMYNGLLIGKGLIVPGRMRTGLPLLSSPDSILATELRPGYLDDADYLWQLPATAPEWAQLKSVLVMRIRVATIAHQLAQRLLVRSRELDAALQKELPH